MVNQLNIVTANVRGLRTRDKFKALLKALSDNNVHVCLLQETYLTDELTNRVEIMCDKKYVCISSYGTNHSRGVSVLIQNVNGIRIINKRCDNDGRLILVNLEILDEIYTVINVYAPNVDTKRNELLYKLENWITKYAEAKNNCIAGGDYNLTPNLKLDRKLGCENKMDKSRSKFEKMCNTLNLCDIWRVKNPSKVEFTCRMQSRIDLILCSKNLCNIVQNVYIKHPYVFSDHQLVFAKLNVTQHPRGPGYWKLNCSVLHDETYVVKVRRLLCKLKMENKNCTGKALWEICKIKIKEFTIMYCKDKQRSEKETIGKLEAELKTVEEQLKNNWCKDLEIKRNNLLISVESHFLQKAKAAQIRARAQWVESGEKSTKFFLGLEKHNQTSNSIKSIKVNDEQITCFENILQEVVNFYTDLYATKQIRDEVMNDYLDNTNLESTLSESDITLCEGMLTMQECTDVIKKMKKNKSPGNDGLPVEFYLTFWEDIKNVVIESLNESFVTGEMSSSQKCAIITLMFKKGDPEMLKNWRPISLLNTDYKIAAFAIANRLQKVLGKIINTDQSGYLRGRFIGSNIRLIEDVIDFTDKNNMQGAALFCDFEKAFDTLEIPFLIKVLKKFKFGSDLQKWITTFYNKINACVKCNNWISSNIAITRGIRQGCPVSALLFILAVEVMAINIRQNKNIKGIKLPGRSGEEAKISQLADDTTLFVNDCESLLNALDEIKRFGTAAGMKLNFKKTVGIWLGKWKERTDKVGEISWTSDLVKALGVYYGHDVKKRLKKNWEDKIAEVNKSLLLWCKRDLTLPGRILIVKTFAVPKLNFLANVIHCPEQFIKEINKLLFSFIWNGKRDKIKRCTMIADKLEGGLKMVDFRLKDYALKVMMLKRILDPGNDKWKAIPLHYLKEVGYSSILFNVERLPQEWLEKMYIPQFYKQLIVSLFACKYHTKSPLVTVVDVRQQLIWGNNLIKYKQKTLWFTKWIKSNIIFVNDLFDPSGNFDENALYRKVKDKSNIVSEMYQVKNAICEDWKHILSSDTCKLHVKCPSESDVKCLDKHGHSVYLKDITSSCVIYSILVNIHKKAPCTKTLWNNVFINKNIMWKNIYYEKLCNVKEQKIVAFNFKVLNNILATPYKLFKWKLISIDTCHLCFSIGSLEHMMLECAYFQPYYKTILNIFAMLGYRNIKFDLYNLVCGYKAGIDVYKPINLILNIIYFTVYKCWVRIKINRVYENPLHVLRSELMLRCQTDIYNYNLFLKFTKALQDCT